MKGILFRSILAFGLAIPAVGLFVSPCGAADEGADLDGVRAVLKLLNLPAKTITGEGGRPIDIVGDASHVGTGTGLAKGNAYRVDTSVVLTEAEFWLTFSNTQTLTYYVFDSPIEFGSYTEVYRGSQSVTGVGTGWYSSGPICIPLSAGTYYIIAVSWNGTLTYYYGVGDSQATSFGAHVHGHATGYDPLPASIESMSNDQAIYYQRLTTGGASPAEGSTWGSIKSLYR
jgi:hypothetical protein